MKRFPVGLPDGADSECAFPIREQILRFGLRLLRLGPLSDELLDLVVRNIGASGRCALSGLLRQARDDDGGPESEDPDSLVRALRHTHRRGSAPVPDMLREQIILAAPPGRDLLDAPVASCKELDELSRSLELDEAERRLVAACYAYACDPAFERLCELTGIGRSMPAAACLLEVPMGDLRKCVAASARLRSSGVLEENVRMGFLHLDLNALVRDHLSGLGTDLGSAVCRQDCGDVLPLDTFPVTGTQLAILDAVLKADRPIHVLLHGAPGTGKTEFARSIARTSGKRAWFLNDERADLARDILFRLTTAAQVLNAVTDVVIVDEADRILASRVWRETWNEFEKGVLNRFLDASKATMIWIANDTSTINPSVLRRFGYSVEFRAFTRRQREYATLWLQGNHTGVAVIPSSDLADLTARHRASVGHLEAAFRVMDSLRESAPDVAPLQALEEVFDQQRRLFGGRAPRRPSPGAPAFAFELLNTDVDITELVTALESEGVRRGATLLFSGPPGTGKTALARHLADSLGLRLLERNASDLLSMWVGGTEAAIRDAFAEAESDGAILLVDEVDSFLRSRAVARHAWEVTQVNEMLVQIEGFAGVLICCTNRLESVDPAALRRFAWKVRFAPLRADQRVAAVTHYFPGIGLTPKEEDAVRALAGLTVGDVAAVRRHCQPESNTAETNLVAFLRREINYTNPPRMIGFA